jgi:hypothetical protein
MKKPVKPDVSPEQTGEMPMSQLDPKDQKEGYVPFIVHKGAHRILMYIQEGMPLFAGYDAALDIAVHLREVYRTQVQKALDEQNKAAAQDTQMATATQDTAQQGRDAA